MVLARMTGTEVDDDLSRWDWMRGDPEQPPLDAWLAERAAERAAFRQDPGVRPLRERAAAALASATALGHQGTPFLAGGAVLSLDRLPGHAHRTIVRRAPGAPAPHPLLDGAGAGIDWFHPSPTGRFLALGRSQRGSEQSVGTVLDTGTGRLLADRLFGVRHACVSWLPAEDAFAYSRYPGGRDYGRELWIHRLGESQGADVLLWPNTPDSTDWPDVEVSPDGTRALVHVSIGWTRTDVYLVDLRDGSRAALVEGREAMTRLHFTPSGGILGVTGIDAPRGRLVRVEPGDPGPAHWQELLPEGEAVLEDCSARDDGVFLVGEREMSGVVGFLPLSVEAPAPSAADDVEWARLGIGDVGIAWPTPGRSTMRDRVVRHRAHRTAVFAWSSLTAPARIMEWTPGSAPRPLDPGEPVDESFRTRSLSVEAGDGEHVPALVLEPVGADAPLPTLLHGYGGFGLSSTGGYSDVARAWVALGGRYVVAGLRGGRERGAAWHEAGRLQRRQRVFDDFADVADALVSRGLCTRERLAIWGSSNGGLLIAATIVRRPDLCAAAHAAVPMTDMLGYHRLSIARLWAGDFGDPTDPGARPWIRASSPMHNLPDGSVALPDIIVTTGRNDTRVAPFHSYAFVEALRERRDQAARSALLLAEDPDAGHGVGKPADAFVDERADVFALFLSAFARRLGERGDAEDDAADSVSL